MVSSDQDDVYEILWEYEHSKGVWMRYEESLNAIINARSGGNVVRLECEESQISVDIEKMQQRNMNSGFVRSIRCAIRKWSEDDAFVWKYLGDKRRLICLNDILAMELEKGLRAKLIEIEADCNGISYKINLNKMTMNIDGDDYEYKIRHTVSDAQDAMMAKPAPSAEQTRSLRKRPLKEENDSEDDELKANKGSSKTCGNPKKRGRKNENSEVAKSDASLDDGVQGKKIQSSVEPESSKMKKVLLKGAAPVDSECLQKLHSAHVYMEDGEVYDALLSQTDTKKNNNKYIILQLLEDDCVKNFSVWIRWGRVGYKGQHSLIPFGPNLHKAEEAFRKKFNEKTSINWSRRLEFRKTRGKYDYIVRDYASIVDQKSGDVDEENARQTRECSLPEALQNFLKLICNVEWMEQTVLELEFDSSKLPLGNITRKQIIDGYSALKVIENFIKEKKFSSEFIEAVDDYYTKIPHFFGMKAPTLIKTIKLLKAELSLLDALSNIEIAIKLFDEVSDGNVKLNPLEQQYIHLKCELKTVDTTHPHYKLIEKYLQNTHGDTHTHYRMHIRNVFATYKDGGKEEFRSKIGNRYLLWHGSRISNIYGILHRGLCIAPIEAPVSGYMFGKGIYFADMSSKSANYCYPQGKSGVLILAEVALGGIIELYKHNCDAGNLKDGQHSVKGMGLIKPNPLENETFDNGCIVPCGKPIQPDEETKAKFNLMYNEYIVYNVDQVCMRFLVEVDFIYD